MIAEKGASCQDVNQTLVKFCDSGASPGKHRAEGVCGIPVKPGRIYQIKIGSGLPYNQDLLRQAASAPLMNERKTTGLPDKIYGDILNRILE
ncbi:MAG: hypothetical protein ACN6OQ_14015, partial [Paraburkholderia nemoris]